MERFTVTGASARALSAVGAAFFALLLFFGAPLFALPDKAKSEPAESGVVATVDEIPDEMKSQDVLVPELDEKAEEPEEKKAESAAPPAPISGVAPAHDAHEITVLKQLSGPRQTVQFFIDSCSKTKYFDAVRTMDFSNMPELNAADRQEYAHELAGILIRLDNFDIDSIPESYDEDECYLWPDHNYKALSLKRHEDGTWKFSASTIADIPSVYAEIRDKKPVFLKDTFWGRLPDWMYNVHFGLLSIQWIILAVFFLAGLLINKLVPFITSRVIVVFTKLRRSKKDFSKKFEWALRPLAYIGTAWVWFAGLKFVSVNPKLLMIAFVVLHPICVIMLMLLLLRLVDIFKFWLQIRLNCSVNKVKSVLVDLSSGVLKFLVISSAVIAIAQIFGISALGIVSGMGIGGIAVALAAQQTIANFFGSMTILLDHPFTVGDYIIVGGIEGVVERIGLRSTVIRTICDSHVVIPNGQLAGDVVDNVGRRHLRRFKAMLGLQYDTPVSHFEAFCAGVRQLIEQRPDTRKDDIRVSVYEFGASSVDIQMICYFTVDNIHDELASRDSLMLDIMRLANALGVSFAFPSQTTYVVPTENLTYPNDEKLHDRDSAEEFGRKIASGIGVTEKTDGDFID